ncbi:MAG: glycosyltransferase family 4 protein [Burkholderiales bacterium]|nr:glycosyltransferase family 4 protein [Burkholderiales bacterium]
MSIYINTRVLHSHLTGVQRYVIELVERFGANPTLVAPRRTMQGANGHAWEQFILPLKVARNTLFSPSITGPLAVKRQVVAIHDVVPLDHPEWLNPKFAAWYGFLVPKLARRVAHVVTISEFSKSRILAHTRMDERQITVTPLAADAKFRPLPQDVIDESLGSLNLPTRHYILCVGSLEPRKNLARLLQAWRLIEKRIPDDVWLVLTGKQGNARVFAHDAGLNELPRRVHLTGHVLDEQLPALYAGALVFAYPSVYEGFGLPPLEAMACGVPVLTGNQTSLPEVVGDAGVTVDPYDVDALADGMVRLVEDGALRDQLRSKGLVRTKQFSWDETARRTWEILERVDRS